MNIQYGHQKKMEFISFAIQQHPQWTKAKKMLYLLEKLDEDVNRIVDAVGFKQVQIDQLKPESQTQSCQITLSNKMEKDCFEGYLNLDQNHIIRPDENFDDMEMAEITYTAKGTMKIKNTMGTQLVCRFCHAIFGTQRQLGGHTQKKHRMTK